MFKPTLIAALPALGAPAFAADPTLTEAQLDATMAKADPDKDSTLDLAEYLAALAAQAE